MSNFRKVDEMSEEARLAVLERLIAHLRFGSRKAAAEHDVQAQEQFDDLELILQQHCVEIAHGREESCERIVSEAIRILSAYYAKYGEPSDPSRLN